MVGLDITAVNVALPSLGTQLDASISWLQWTVSAYTRRHGKPAAVLRLDGRPPGPPAHARDRPRRLHGARRCCAASRSTVELLVAFRVCRASAPRCSTLSRCRSSPTRSPSRASGPRRSGSGARCSARRWRSGRSSAARSSPPAGWEWIFLMNLPLGVAAIALTLRFVPESRAPRPRRFDPSRPGPGDRAAGDGDLRDHRGAERRMDVAGDPHRVRRRGDRTVAPCCATSPAARTRSSTFGSSARSRSRPRSRSRSRRSPRSADSSSSTRSTCRTSAGSPPWRPASPSCRSRS